MKQRAEIWSSIGVGLIALGMGLVHGADLAKLSPEDRARIEAAAPSKPLVPPAKPRRLLIFDHNVGYGGHPSAAHASYAFKWMGEKTGAFDSVVSSDPEMFRHESLSRFDAVFFNNTVGNLFTNTELRRNLVEFVCGGGGMMGTHGATVAFTQWPGAVEDWPEFGRMIGARGANHRESTERVFLRLDDPTHPLTAAFGGQGFDFRDEFFRVQDPYSRQRVRVLLSIDTEKTDLKQGRGFGQLERADNDFALAWARAYGRGRTFYCTIAHNPYVFWDSKMLAFYLGAAQFVLGDLAAPTTPSAKLTPAMRAQERLGWRLGVEAYTFHKYSFFETIEKTAQLGLSYLGGLSFQKVGGGIEGNLDEHLSDADLERIRLKLDDAGLRLLTFYHHQIPNDLAACRRLFEFGRKLGIETFMGEPAPEALPVLESLCNACGINLALHNHAEKDSPHTWHPDRILALCRDRSPRIGAAADVGYWMRSSIDPVAAIRTLKDRLITLQMHDLHALSPEGHDVPWGSGVGRSAEVFREIRRLGLRPTMIGLEFSYDWEDSMPEVAQCIEFFNQVSQEPQ